MKSVFRLILTTVLLANLAFTCEPDCLDRCYAMRTEVFVEDSAEIFYSVYNIENKQEIFNWDEGNSMPDSLQVWISMDPTRDTSSFVFKYSNRPNDTVVISHEYEAEYNDRCEDYIFEFFSAQLVTNTFGPDFSFYASSQCFSAQLYLH